MNLKTLPYPLFKVTKAEADLLCGAMEQLKSKHTTFLCNNLGIARSEYNYRKTVYYKLIDKVRNSINCRSSLLFYLKDYRLLDLPIEEHYKIRQIWINKLLEFNGYEQVEL